MLPSSLATAEGASPPPRGPTAPAETSAPPRIETRRLTATFGKTVAVRDASVAFPTNTVTAIIGPSGCGKSTFLRCLNRLHELTDGGRMTGKVLLDGEDIYQSSVDAVELRRRVGMVFQRPTPFPTMSVFDNVAAGLRIRRGPNRAAITRAVEKALRSAALWDEVQDRLNDSPLALSGGQQQRLCIARAIAPEPEVLLLDEPTSSLDPMGTQAIEDLVQQLKQEYTVVIVTHNMLQAARVSDFTVFFYLGTMVEHGPTAQLFTRPQQTQTEAYVTGRFG